MYTIKNDESVYILISNEKYYKKYNSYTDFLLNTTYEFAYNNIGSNFNQYRCYNWYYDKFSNKMIKSFEWLKYVVRTSYGYYIPRKQILQDVKSFESRRGIYLKSKNAKKHINYTPYVRNKCIFRYDAVPNIYSRRRRYKSQFRHMKTTNERRNFEKLLYDIKECEYNIHHNKRRTDALLPNCYDDIYRNDWKNRNWKRYRKHQYKI